MNKAKQTLNWVCSDIAVVLVATLLFLQFGCAGAPVTKPSHGDMTTIADIASVTVLLDAYEGAKRTLNNRLNDLPPDTGMALIELEQEADQLVADYQSAWRLPTSLVFIDDLVERTSLLYAQGKDLVQPHLSMMSLDEQQQLRRLDAAWSRTESAYTRWQADPVTQDRTALIEAGIDFATALLLILG